jgi:glycosyltransferase involved in cell wall biosynthesis
MKSVNFSIVVPTHGRVSTFASLLESLVAARTRFPGETELLVVDSSKGQEAVLIQDLCEAKMARYLRCENHVCRKRNLGIYKASHPYVFLTDSDCEVPSDILLQHANCYQSLPEDIGGVLGLTIIIGNVSPIWHTLKLDTSFAAAFSFARWLEYAPWGTCTNISFRKDILLRAGAFKSDWPLKVYGEDVDLGLRVNKLGFRIACNSQAVVKHNSSEISSFNQVLRKKFLTGRADYYLEKQHPEQLAPEFPGWTGIAILLFLVALVRTWIFHSPSAVFWTAICILIGVLFQAYLTARATRTGTGSILRHAAVVFFEATFDLGRLFESFRHGAVYRLWTKFVYLDRQLLGERDKRIRQMWSYVLVFLCLFALFGSGFSR